jgi:gliding motility-associated-like protein
MKRIIWIFSLILLLINVKPLAAQTDTEFWFAVPRVTISNDWDNKQFYFRFVNSDIANTITIRMPENTAFQPITVNLAPNEAATVDVKDIIQNIWTDDPNQVLNRGIKIEALNLTTAYFEIGTNKNKEKFTLKGSNALGKRVENYLKEGEFIYEFFVPFQDQFANADLNIKPYSGIYIVATEDQTRITITPTQPVFPGKPAGVPFTFILHAGQTIAIVPHDFGGAGQAANRHLGGTRIVADNPIAITTSDDSVGPDPLGTCIDVIGDQLVPTSIIGSEYIAIRSPMVAGALPTMPEYFYIVATRPNTQVFIDGDLKTTLQPGQQFRWAFTEARHHIKTSAPVYVFHVAVLNCEMGGALLPPIDICSGSTKLPFTRSAKFENNNGRFFMHIMVRKGAQDGFILNGNGPNTLIKASDFTTVAGNTNWMVAEYEFSSEAIIPTAIASLLENTKDVFHLGIINGGPDTGTMYGYFSNFNEMKAQANVSGTGSWHRACLGEPVQLVAHGGTKYQWSPPEYLDDPTSATPIAIPATSIKYTVTVIGACQMVSSADINLGLFGPANAAFTVDTLEGCAPFTIDVNNASNGIIGYSWRMGDGTVYTTSEKHFNHTYLNDTPSTITRELILVGNYNLCTDTMRTNIQVHPTVTAIAKPTVISGCSPLSVDFSNLSTNAHTFIWEFGDGSSSNARDASHIFHNLTGEKQIYTVNLTALSNTGCSDHMSFEIEVLPYIQADFTFTPSVHCSPYPVQINNISYHAIHNHWSFDDGNTFETNNDQTFSRPFTNNGNQPDVYNFWLITENQYGCRDTLVKKLTVLPAIKASFKADVVEGCNPLPVQFTNYSSGANTFLWEFGNHIGNSSETNPLVLFDNPSLTDTLIFNVRLRATSEWFCSHDTILQIKVYPRINAEFTFDYTSFCTPQELTFYNSSVGATTSTWNFGNGAIFTGNDIVISQTYFNNTTTTVQYPVTLKIMNDNGCSAEMTREVTIYPKVNADFSMISSGCHPLEVTFENKSSGASTYLWDFGDGGHSRQESLSRIYTNTSHTEPKIYTIRLLAESEFGCTHIIDKQITVFPKPKADYSLSQVAGCAPLPINFTGNAIGATVYHWEYGDGTKTTSPNSNTSHTYENNGENSSTFISRLIVNNQHGCRDTISRGAEVYPVIKAKIALEELAGCHPFQVQINNQTTGASSAGAYQWSFGDGNRSTTAQQAFKYTWENFSNTQSQQFTLRLEAESMYGCKDFTQTNITVYPKPKSVFEPLITEGCSPLPVNFENGSIGATTYNWHFGDGITSTQTGETNHLYHRDHDKGAGIFPVGLKVANSFGCSDSTARQITVYPDITAEFTTLTEGCHPLEVQFTNQSLGAGTIRWEFGDGSVSSLTNPFYIFTNESHTANKEYIVNLHTSSVFGCKASASDTITVNPRPKASFQLNTDEGCAPLPVAITNLSEGGTLFNWQFGHQQGTQSAPQFIYTFTNDGEVGRKYIVSLEATNDYGCYRQTSQEIIIYPEVKAAFCADNDLLAGCSPLSLSFENQSARAHKYSWDFGDGNYSALPNPENRFFTHSTHPGLYDIKLKAESVYGCTDIIVRTARVYPVPMADLFVSPHAQIYPSATIRIENLSSPGEWQFEWDLGDGTRFATSSWETLEHEYIWPNDDYATKHYTVSLKTSNPYCFDTITQEIVINAPQPAVGFEPAAKGCAPFEIQFRNDSKYGLEYFWDFNDGSFSNQESPSHIFTKPGEYMVKLLVSGEGGIDSAYQTITVFEQPKADFRVTPEKVQLPYQHVQMVNLSSLASYYEWNMGDGTIYYDAQPTHLYQDAGVYDIRLHVATNTFPQCFDTVLKAGAVVAEKGCQIIFPDAFSPSSTGPSDGSYIINDPANHVFYPIHTGIKQYRMEIYSRWGELLFRTTDLEKGWDGYHRGKLLPMDVYVWKVKAICHSGKEIEAAGDVTLYR